MSSPPSQGERENLARTIGTIWETLSSPNGVTPISLSHASTPHASTPHASTPHADTISDGFSPAGVSSHTSNSPASPASTSDQPHIDVRHDSCQVNMSVNTDALAAELSRRDDRHEERIPCRKREAHERGPKIEQEAPNFVFGDAARQQRPQPTIQMQYSDTSTRVQIRDISNRQVGLNFGTDGRSLGLTLGGAPGIGTWHFLLSIDSGILAVIICVLVGIGIWFLRG